MQTRIFPLIHKYTLRNIQPKKFPWGWRSQKQIRKIVVQNVESKHQPCHFNETIQKKIKFNEPEFLKGAIQGYRKIFKQFSKKRDFLNVRYTTPELSLALNHVSSFSKHLPTTKLSPLQCKVMTSWIEVGIANSNSNILGIWDIELIKQDLSESNVNDLWDIYVGPLKQKVRVLYTLNKNHLQVWEWEKCLMRHKEEWTVSNINEILI